MNDNNENVKKNIKTFLGTRVLRIKKNGVIRLILFANNQEYVLVIMRE